MFSNTWNPEDTPMAHPFSNYMTDPSRSVRVFLSSTFRDMQQERDHLNTIVLPRLRAKARARAVDLTWVDLRWGITENQSKSGEVVRLCLKEIDHCVPFFVGLLGHRYGWVPKHGELSPKTTKDFEFVSEMVERKCSVTEMEIVYGVLDRPDMHDKAFFYEASQENSISKGGESVEPPGSEAGEKQENLKRCVQVTLAAVGRVANTYESVAQLGEQLEHDFGNFLNQRFPAREAPDSVEQGFIAHAVFARTRLRTWIGGAPLLRALDDALEKVNTVLVTGDSGLGKTALLANWLKTHAQTDALFFFCGGAPASVRSEDLLLLWSERLRTILLEWGVSVIPDKNFNHPDVFQELLLLVPQNRHLWLVLDAVNQLTDAGSLSWWPKQIPAHIRVLMSTLPGKQQDLLSKRGYAEVTVVPMDIQWRRRLLRIKLGKHGKRIKKSFEDLIFNDHDSNKNPLMLCTLVEELITFGSHEDLESRIKWYSETDSIDRFFGRVLERIGGIEGADNVLPLIGASRWGLSEAEIRIFTGLDPLGWATLHEHLRPHLVDRNGLLGFFHDYIRQAVKFRYFHADGLHRSWHSTLADQFDALSQSGDEVLARRGFAELLLHLIEAERWPDAFAHLMDFHWLMEACRVGALESIIEGWLKVSQHAPTEYRKDPYAIYAEFFREHAHLLRKIIPDWGTDRILFQLAIEHADDSPLTIQAEKFLVDCHVNWHWLRDTWREPHTLRNRCTAVMEHMAEVNGALALQDGRILSWSTDHTLRIWDANTGECLHILEGHKKDVTGAKLMQNGLVLSWSHDQTLRIWDTNTGECLRVLAGHSMFVWGSLVLPDGRILSWSGDNTLRIWDSNSGQCLFVLEGHTHIVKDSLVMQNGHILSWSYDNSLRIWNADTGTCIQLLSGHNKEVNGALTLSDDQIISWSNDNTLRIWDTSTGACLQVLEGHAEGVTGALALPKGRILSWSWDKTLRIWDMKTAECIQVLGGHSSGVTGVQTLPQGRIFSWCGTPYGSTDSTIQIWDPDTDVSIRVQDAHTEGVTGVHALSDGKLLSWSNDHTLRIWDTDKGTCLQVLEGHANHVKGSLTLPDGQILSWSRDNTLRLWNPRIGTSQGIRNGDACNILGTLALPDNRTLSWGKDTTLHLWDSITGAHSHALKGHTNSVNGALILPDGRPLSWSWDKTLRIWDTITGACLQVLRGHTSGVTGALSLTNGKILSWSGSFRDPNGKALRIWDCSTGKCIKVLEGHTGEIKGALAMPDSHILTWSDDKTLRIWDEITGTCIVVMKGHSNSVKGARIMSDGRILSWSLDLRIWDASTGSCVQVLEGHTGFIRDAAPIATFGIVTWSDHEVFCWNLGSSSCVQTFPSRRALSITHPNLHQLAFRECHPFSNDAKSVHHIMQHSYWLSLGRIIDNAQWIKPNGQIVMGVQMGPQGVVKILTPWEGNKPVLCSLAPAESSIDPEKVWEDFLQTCPTLNRSSREARISGQFKVATSYLKSADLSEANRCLLKALEDCAQQLEANHPFAMVIQLALSTQFQNDDEHKKIIEEIEKLVDYIRILGPDHPDTLNAKHRLGFAYSQLGLHHKIIHLREDVFADRSRILGPKHADTIESECALAITCSLLGKHEAAVNYWEDVLAERIRILGPNHSDVNAAKDILATTYSVLKGNQEVL
jgi:WD40 repeat protein/tetratricopeptide (TPR) repeat protein